MDKSKEVKVELRKATLENLRDILNLNQQLFDYEYENFDKTLDCNWTKNNKEYFRKSITGKNSHALVAIADGKVVGYLVGCLKKAESYRQVQKIAEIENMSVLPEYRGKKIGTALCKRFIEWVKKRGIKRIKVTAQAQNKLAIAFYRKIGFLDYTLNLEKNV